MARRAVPLLALVVATGLSAPVAGATLDRSFAGDGRKTLPVGHQHDVSGVDVQPNGRIVVVARERLRFRPSGIRTTLIGLRPSGRIDRGFGVRGRVRLRFDSAFASSAPVFYPDGRIAIVSRETAGATTIVRLTAGGRRDPTFGDRGMARVAWDVAGAALQPDGRIVVAVGNSDPGAEAELRVGRLLTDGSVDSSFGAAGLRTIPGGEREISIGVGTDAGGAITVRGWRYGAIYHPKDSGAPVTARLLADGRDDPAAPGVRLDGPRASASFLPDGRMLSAGVQRYGEDSLDPASSDFLVERFQPDGALDQAFGVSGRATIDFLGRRDAATAAIADARGRIVVGGRSVPEGGRARFAVARVSADGRALDRGFSGDGLAVTRFERWASVQALALQPDGRIVAAGNGRHGDRRLYLVRYRAR